jgi:hypothetical protein
MVARAVKWIGGGNSFVAMDKLARGRSRISERALRRLRGLAYLIGNNGPSTNPTKPMQTLFVRNDGTNNTKSSSTTATTDEYKMLIKIKIRSGHREIHTNEDVNKIFLDPKTDGRRELAKEQSTRCQAAPKA